MYPLFDEFINKIINETAYGKFLKIHVDIRYTILGTVMECHFSIPTKVDKYIGVIENYIGFDYQIIYEPYFEIQMPHYIHLIDHRFIDGMAEYCKNLKCDSIALNVNTQPPIFEI